MDSNGFEDLPVGGGFAASDYVLDKLEQHGHGRQTVRRHICGALVPDTPQAREEHLRECSIRAVQPGQPKGATMATKTTPSGKQAAIDILREADGGPLPVKQVTAEAAKRAKLGGKTPAATIAAVIYSSAKRGVLFRKVGKGEVELLPEVTQAEADDKQVEPDPKPSRRRSSKAQAAVEPTVEEPTVEGEGAEAQEPVAVA